MIDSRSFMPLRPCEHFYVLNIVNTLNIGDRRPLRFYFEGGVIPGKQNDTSLNGFQALGRLGVPPTVVMPLKERIRNDSNHIDMVCISRVFAYRRRWDE